MNGSLPLLMRWLTSVGIIPKAAVAQLGTHQAPRVLSVLDAGRMAERVYAALDALDRDVVLIARAGQNLQQFGLRYSHAGFAVRGLHGRDWGIVHLLTKDDSDRSSIYCEGLVNFFSDNPYEMACLVQALPPSVERVLFQSWPALAKKLHCSNYSLTSYPWSLSTQNSTQWVLETIALCTAPEAPSREMAQAWLLAQGFTPTSLSISLPIQWAGPLLRDSIRFTDQPDASRKAGQVHTVTVEGILQFLTTAPIYEAERASLKRVELSL